MFIVIIIMNNSTCCKKRKFNDTTICIWLILFKNDKRVHYITFLHDTVFQSLFIIGILPKLKSPYGYRHYFGLKYMKETK